MPRLTKIYTKKGDSGNTSLGGGQTVAKDSLRVQVYGTIDELNSQLGVALSSGLTPSLAETLSAIQNDLFDLGSDLCFLEADKKQYEIPQIEARHVRKLETLIDEMVAIVGPLENFILPGGTLSAAHLHVARTICRRVERDTSTLMRDEEIGTYVLPYLNRLSDVLFVMARFENYTQNMPEPLWKPGM